MQLYEQKQYQSYIDPKHHFIHSYFIMPIAEFILPPFTLALRKRHSAPIRLPLSIAFEVSQTEAPACTRGTPSPS
jgi:hypothetical protein